MKTFIVSTLTAYAAAVAATQTVNADSYVGNWDDNNDGHVSTLDFLQDLGHDNAEGLASQYPENHEWWDDSELMATAFTDVKDTDDNGLVSSSELVNVLSELVTGSSANELITMYANNPDGLTKAELKEILGDMKGTSIRDVPDWFSLPDS